MGAVQMELYTHKTDLALASGDRLPGAELVTAIWGKLNAARDNLILFPTRFGGTHDANAFLIGDGMALDPSDYCIVVPNMLGNGVSSSPSNTGLNLDFPRVTHADNMAIQAEMLAALFGDVDIALAVGWSMGAQQSCRWAVHAPERVKRLMMVCGTAQTTPHNRVFLEALLAAMEADPHYAKGEVPSAGLRAAGRIYAGWAYSQPWLKRAGYQELGYNDLDDWLVRYWDALFAERHAGDVTAMVRTWIANDVADGGDLGTALGRITARTHVMTSVTDLYFTPPDCRAEAAMISRATYADIETDWGHMCGSGQSERDTHEINAAIAEMLHG